jgi:hypothetical protein
MKSPIEVIRGWRVNVPDDVALKNNGLMYEHKCLTVTLDILETILSLTPVDPIARVYEHEAYLTEGRNSCLEEIHEIARVRVDHWRAREEEIRVILEEQKANILKTPGS